MAEPRSAEYKHLNILCVRRLQIELEIKWELLKNTIFLELTKSLRNAPDAERTTKQQLHKTIT